MQITSSFREGSNDFQNAIRKINVPISLGYLDVVQRYVRSKLGPWWLTISMAITILGMGFVFGTLFGSPLRDFLPFLALGMVTWTFILSTLMDGCAAFTGSTGIIRQYDLPTNIYIIRVLWRNIIIYGHNIIIYPVMMLVFSIGLSWNMLLAIPGFILLVGNLYWMAIIFAVLCTRFRDLTQIVNSVLQLWFFVTPIIWTPELMIEKGRAAFLNINPFYHMIEVVREPLLGGEVRSLSWIFCIVMLIVGGFVATVFLGRYNKRIAYWV